MGNDFQRGENFQAQKHELINIGADIVTDVLGLFIGILSLVTVGLYFWLKQIITTQAIQSLEAKEKKLRFGLYVDLSNSLYSIYRQYLDREIFDMFTFGVKLAINYAEEAIEVAKSLPDGDLGIPPSVWGSGIRH